MGSVDEYDGLTSTLAGLASAIIVSVDYRLAPEFPFPASLEDAMAATLEVARRARELGGDPGRLAVMGDSAGGNLAAVVAAEAPGRGLHLAAQFLLYPMLDVSRPHSFYPSRLSFGDGRYFLANSALDASLRAYVGERQIADDPRISPLNATSFCDLPPTRLFVGGLDPLLDESRVYSQRLSAAGIDSRCEEFAGEIHGFLSFGTLPGARAARHVLARSIVQTLGGDRV